VFLVPKEEEVPEPLPQDIYSWAKQHGIPAYRQTIRLIISSTDDTPVVITGIRGRVISRETPPEGWFVLQDDPSCGGGELEPKPVLIDLGRSRTNYSTWPRDDSGAPKPLEANEDSHQVIDIDADPGGDLVEWELLVDYSLGGKDDTYTVREKNEPLRVTGLVPGRATAYQPDNAYEYGQPLTSLVPVTTPVLGEPPISIC
jgi:hypothetical protein